MIRKRIHHNDVLASYGGSRRVGFDDNKDRPRRPRWCCDHIGCLTILSFLALAVFAVYALILSGHHRVKVALHVAKNQWQDRVSKFHDHVSQFNGRLRDPVEPENVAPIGDSSGQLRANKGDREKKHLRFVTVVMPSVVNPTGRTKRLEAISNTWGPAAKAIYVVHELGDYPDASSDLSSQSYPQSLLVPASIGQDQGVPRLQHVITVISETANPDFAFFVNDHTFVIPEHLCHFLQDKVPYEDLYAGHALKNEKEDYAFLSGAAGYVLSRSTMRKLVEKWTSKDPLCAGVDRPKWLQGNPGLMTAQCLHHGLHIRPFDAGEENGKHRFHAFGLVRTVTGKVDEWYLNKHKHLDPIVGIDHVHHHLPGKGRHCCAARTVSFHYVERAETLALHQLRLDLKKDPKMSDKELQDRMIQMWPSEWKELGGYSHGLPKKTEHETWEHLLHVVRKISLTPDDMSNC